MDWAALPIQHIPLATVVWPCHDIDPDHVHSVEGVELSTGPIHLEQLLDGSHFVHDGRHRVIRAQHAGHTHIPARIHP